MGAFQHVSAMLAEAIEALNCRPGGIYVDCTLGGGGHSEAICEKIGPDGILIGLDQDDAAIEHNTIRLAPYASRTHLFHSNYVHLAEILSKLKIPAVDGILLDLGLSQYQLEGSGRGFLFRPTNRWICAWINANRPVPVKLSTNIRWTNSNGSFLDTVKNVGPNASPGPS